MSGQYWVVVGLTCDLVCARSEDRDGPLVATRLARRRRRADDGNQLRPAGCAMARTDRSIQDARADCGVVGALATPRFRVVGGREEGTRNVYRAGRPGASRGLDGV